MPIATAKLEKSSHSIGWSTRPRLTSALFTKPARPSTNRHAKERIKALVKNGMVKSTIRVAARRGRLIRPMTVEAGNARMVQKAAVSVARPTVRIKTGKRPVLKSARYESSENAGLIQYVA